LADDKRGVGGVEIERKSMKVIFLDIDGVLNCSSTRERIDGIFFVEDQKIEYLKEIIECTGAVVVLSSTWRIGWAWMQHNPDYHDKHFEMLRDKLQEHGIQLFGRTPTSNHGVRGLEIDEWLRHHSDVESFVILDDDSDMDKHIGRLVKTRWRSTGAGGGLLRKHIRPAIELLNKHI
jgi:hypothetical protein